MRTLSFDINSHHEILVIKAYLGVTKMSTWIYHIFLLFDMLTLEFNLIAKNIDFEDNQWNGEASLPQWYMWKSLQERFGGMLEYIVQKKNSVFLDTFGSLSLY